MRKQFLRCGEYGRIIAGKFGVEKVKIDKVARAVSFATLRLRFGQSMDPFGNLMRNSQAWNRGRNRQFIDVQVMRCYEFHGRWRPDNEIEQQGTEGHVVKARTDTDMCRVLSWVDVTNLKRESIPSPPEHVPQKRRRLLIGNDHNIQVSAGACSTR